MSSINPSLSFEDAASYLSHASNLSSLPNELKLELYGLFKFLTVSPEPKTARPSIFSFEGRAKWDAWKTAGNKWQDQRKAAEERYIDIAKSLGWKQGHNRDTAAPRSSPTPEELLDDERPLEANAHHNGTGMGFGVSSMAAGPPDEPDDETLHGLAISGNAEKLLAILDALPSCGLNDLDEFGYTPLHLACDRGHASVVAALLSKGADVSIKDEDGLSALDLAREAHRDDIVTLLESSEK